MKMIETTTPNRVSDNFQRICITLLGVVLQILKGAFFVVGVEHDDAVQGAVIFRPEALPVRRVIVSPGKHCLLFAHANALNSLASRLRIQTIDVDAHRLGLVKCKLGVIVLDPIELSLGTTADRLEARRLKFQRLFSKLHGDGTAARGTGFHGPKFSGPSSS
jgi:hypothetical protein